MHRHFSHLTSRLATYCPAIVATLTVLAFGFMLDMKARELACRLERDRAAEYLGGLKFRIEDAARTQFGHLDQLTGALTRKGSVIAPDLYRIVDTDIARLDKIMGIALLSHATGEVITRGEVPNLETLTEIVQQGDPDKPGAQHLPGASPQSVAIWLPVITDDETGQGQVSGQAVALVDAQKFFGEAGLNDRIGQYEIAITENVPTAPGQLRGMILGSPGVGSHDPVRTRIVIPGGEWTLEIAPAGGWTVPPGTLLPIRGLTLVAAFGVAFLMVRQCNQSERRLESLRTLQRTQIGLLEATQRFELALGSACIGVLDYDVASGDLHWDRTAREQYDIESDRTTICYKDWLCCIHPEDRARIDTAFWEAVDRRSQFGATFRVVDRRGGIRVIEVVANCVGDPGSAPHVVGLSKEVSTPPEDRTAAPPLHLALSELPDPAGPGTAATRFRLSEVDPRSLAEDLAMQLSAGRRESGRTYAVVSSTRLPARVHCDALRLRQVLTNLLGSARGRADGLPIVLHLDHDASGRGTLLASVEAASLGTGLSTCKEIVAAMGGGITWRSGLRLGTRLVLGIPAPDPTGPRAAPARAGQTGHLGPAGAMFARRDLTWTWTWTRRRGDFGGHPIRI